jgi:DNA polymerase I-like protein with 3'-5' exonuclease and polymerase domains
MWTLRGVYDKFRDEGYAVNFLMPVHDEIVSECDEAVAEELKAATVKCMADVNDYTQLLVPVVAEGKVTSRWTK